jgi:hypothetical protein
VRRVISRHPSGVGLTAMLLRGPGSGTELVDFTRLGILVMSSNPRLLIAGEKPPKYQIKVCELHRTQDFLGPPTLGSTYPLPENLVTRGGTGHPPTEMTPATRGPGIEKCRRLRSEIRRTSGFWGSQKGRACASGGSGGADRIKPDWPLHSAAVRSMLRFDRKGKKGNSGGSMREAAA